MGMPFCLLLWFHHKDEDLYNRIFIWKDLTVYPAFFQLHYFSSSGNGSVVLLIAWQMEHNYSRSAGTEAGIYIQSSRGGKLPFEI